MKYCGHKITTNSFASRDGYHKGYTFHFWRELLAKGKKNNKPENR